MGFAPPDGRWGAVIRGYRNLSTNTRKEIFLALLISGTLFSILSSFTGFRHILGVALVFLVLAGAGLLLSPDNREWFKGGEIFLRFTLWSRKHPILLALIITLQPAIYLTIYFLFIARDIRKLVIAIPACALMFVVLIVYVFFLLKRLEKDEGRIKS